MSIPESVFSKPLAIKNVHGKYLGSTPKKGDLYNHTAVGRQESWYIVPIGDKFLIRNVADPKSIGCGKDGKAYCHDGRGGYEQWEITKNPEKDGFFLLKNHWGKFLGVNGKNEIYVYGKAGGHETFTFVPGKEE